MKPMYNGYDIIVLDYSYLAVIDLINLFILFIMYQRTCDLFADLPDMWGICICLGGDSEVASIVNAFPNS